MKQIDLDKLDAALAKALAHWINTQEDPYNIANAVIAALQEVRRAIISATKDE